MTRPDHAAWRCTDGCDAHGTGTQAETDRAAERHTKATKHTTATRLARATEGDA